MTISMGNIWDRTAEFLSDNLGALLPLAITTIFVPKMIASNLKPLTNGADETTAALLGLLAFAMTLIVYFGQLAVTTLAIDPDNPTAARKLALRRYPHALLVMLILFAALLALLAPYGVILALAGVDVTAMMADGQPNIPAEAALTSSLYMLFALAVLFWLVPRLALVMPAVAGEGKSWGAVVQSWRLTRGLWLKLFGVLLLYVVVSVVAETAVTSIFGVVLHLVSGGGNGLSLASVLSATAGATVSTAFTVLGTAYAAKLYVALLARDQAVAGA